MDRNEVLKQITPFDKYSNLVFIPNEIFDDLLNNNEFRIGKHRAFAYCYFCLITYLYRYSIYGQIVGFKLNQPTLKSILGYSAVNKEVDYVIKRDGILDRMGYTETTKEMPINTEVTWREDIGKSLSKNTSKVKGVENIEFTFLQDLNQEFRGGYFIKCPIKLFNREINIGKDKIYIGNSMESIEFTHAFDMRIFLHAMSFRSDIGIVGFYLYQFINRQENHAIQITLENLEKRTGIKGRTLDRYIKNLEEYNYLDIVHQDYIVNAPKEESVTVK